MSKILLYFTLDNVDKTLKVIKIFLKKIPKFKPL